MKYIPVIGLEIHAELLTKTKLFCGCKNEFGGVSNTRVCQYCMAIPGSLPVLNKNAVVLSAKAGIVLGCDINNRFSFDRKNYFYPDLPKGYQITQLENPICTNGFVEINNKKYRINNIHLEEDAGKLIHDNEKSKIDYNRAGVPLIEIVTEPDFNSACEVKAFVEEVIKRLKYGGVCDAKMEQGSLRVDVNISVMPENAEELGTRAEIKNLNSIRSIVSTIEYEIKRQTEILESGGRVCPETRRFDEKTASTVLMRVKEASDDYRYFPEPDIPYIYISDDEIEKIRNEIPKMPGERYLDYTNNLGLSEDDAELILSSVEFSDFFEEALMNYKSAKTISALMLGEISRCINESGISVEKSKITPKELSSVAKMSDEEKISKNAAKSLVAVLFEDGGEAEKTAMEKGFIMSNDTGVIEKLIAEIISENESLVCEYKNGNEKLFGFFMGQLIRKAGKSANPKLAKDLLIRKLNK